ncbi:MAG: hypothetical protein ABL874_10955 [Sphingopyxis sp.]
MIRRIARMAMALLSRFRRKSPLQQLRDGAWKWRSVPTATEGTATMLMPDELRLLEFLTERYFEGRGAIIDAGCFLGGSTLALASGLRTWLATRGQPETPLIHSYDLFKVEDWTRGIYFDTSTPAGASTRARFDAAIASHAGLITVHAGDITLDPWHGGPIEILFIDIAKHWTVCDFVTEHFFPHLIPGHSVVVQQDYLYQNTTGWLHVTMEYYADEFEMLCDTTYNSVAFRLRKAFAPGRIRPGLVASLPLSEKIALMDRSAARFSGEQRDILLSAKANYLGLLGVD